MLVIASYLPATAVCASRSSSVPYFFSRSFLSINGNWDLESCDNGDFEHTEEPHWQL